MYHRFIVPYLAARDQIHLLFRDSKWMIAIAVLLSAILFAPDQIRELYRVFSADLTFISFTLDDAIKVALGLIKFFVPLIGIAVLVWFGTYQVTTESIARIANMAPVTHAVARLLPALLGALPLLASAAGQLLSSPRFATADGSPELPAGPWDKFGQQLADTIGRGLLVSGLFSLILCIAVAVLAWKWSESLRPWSSRVNRHYFKRGWFYVLSVAAIGVLTVALVLMPVILPQAIGVFSVLALFTLCVIAFCIHLSLLTIKYRFPFIPALFAFALLLAFLDLNDDHDVRALTQTNAVASSDSLPSAADQFEKWYRTRPAGANFDEYPVYIVAAQGGGIYAAYQTAIFLARMHDLCPAFNDHLFAISSVSGGSFGAAAYAAAIKSLADETASAAKTPPGGNVQQAATPDPCPTISEYFGGQPLRRDLDSPGPLEINVRKVFANDFLSPLVSAWLFPEFSQMFIPVPIGQFDRARALEFAFEKSEAVLHTDDRRYLTTNFGDHWTPDGAVPALLVNSTDAASGRRIVMSPFAIGGDRLSNMNSIISYRDLGKDSDDKVQTVPPVIRLSTAAGISARFPWVTPAATIPVGDARLGKSKKIRLVDGGYVDNSGVETALNLLESIQPRVDAINNAPALPSGGAGKKVHAKLIVLSGGDYPVRTTFALGEILEPVRALLSTRTSRAYVAIDTAARRFPRLPLHELPGTVDGEDKISVDASDLRHASLNSRFYPLPLGWSMSNRTRQIIEKQSGHYWECEPDRHFTQSQKSLSETDCIQLLIYHELNQSVASAASEIAIASRLEAPDSDGGSAPRLPHDDLIQCYMASSDLIMSRPQAKAFDALLRIWDSHPEWKDDRLLALMLATIASETANFRIRSDILSFRSAERIRSIWPNRFPTVADAAPFVNKPKELAEAVYKGHFGNTEPGDGWLYRGRGMAMLVGRENYTKYSGVVQLDLVSNPDLVLIPAVGAPIAFAVYFPASTISAVSDTFRKSPNDWAKAIAAVPGVSDRYDIGGKSKVLYDCITKLARAKPAAKTTGEVIAKTAE
jgi:predicted chitinase